MYGIEPSTTNIIGSGLDAMFAAGGDIRFEKPVHILQIVLGCCAQVRDYGLAQVLFLKLLIVTTAIFFRITATPLTPVREQQTTSLKFGAGYH
jgi:hypothetical protein